MSQRRCSYILRLLNRTKKRKEKGGQEIPVCKKIIDVDHIPLYVCTYMYTCMHVHNMYYVYDCCIHVYGHVCIHYVYMYTIHSETFIRIISLQETHPHPLPTFQYVRRAEQQNRVLHRKNLYASNVTGYPDIIYHWTFGIRFTQKESMHLRYIWTPE